MADDFLYDVFLSHNQKDKPRVRRLAEKLKDAGLRVWLDDWVVKAGEIIALKVDEGLEQSRVLVLCMSPNALASGWVALERSTAIHRDPSNQGRRFVPLLLADCDLPDTMRRYKYLDFRKLTKSAFEELLALCLPEDAAPAPAPTDVPKPAKKKEPAREKPTTPEPAAELVFTLIGHKHFVNSVAVSPDGKWAASAGDDTKIKVWDLETGKCKRTLEGHTGDVNSIAITADGQQIVSGAMDQTIRVWDVRSGNQLLEWDTKAYVTGVATLPDSRRAISCGGYPDPSLRVWDIDTGRCLWRLDLSGGEAKVSYGVAISKDGYRGVSGYLNSVLLWDLNSHEWRSVEGHSDKVRSVVLTPDSRYAISGSNDKTVRIWDVEAGVCTATLEGHRQQVMSVDVSPDGRLIASTGFIDDTVRLWERESGRCLQVITNNKSPMSLAFTPDGSRLVVGTSEGVVFVYSVKGLRTTRPAATARRYVNAKVVLLGEGTVGKTSLAHRLVEDKYVIRDRTHGMNVWPLALPLAPDSTMEREALLWDLAGQEDYRLIHQLFLDETALALLLVNPQKDDPFAEAGDWLKALKAACGGSDSARDVNRLLIFSQTDVGGMKLSDAKIERFKDQYGFIDWLPTSAKTGFKLLRHKE